MAKQEKEAEARAAFIAERRARLVAMRTEHLNQVRATTQKGWRAAQEGVARDVTDPADPSGEEDIDFFLIVQKSRALVAIDSALERIEAGVYGICRECGDPISENRLWAHPQAVNCLDCKAREEGRQTTGRRPHMQGLRYATTPSGIAR